MIVELEDIKRNIFAVKEQKQVCVFVVSVTLDDKKLHIPFVIMGKKKVLNFRCKIINVATCYCSVFTSAYYCLPYH